MGSWGSYLDTIFKQDNIAKEHLKL